MSCMVMIGYSHFYLATSDTDVFRDDNVVGVNRWHHGGACALHIHRE